MSKRTAEEDVADSGEQVAPISATRREAEMGLEQHDFYHLAKKQFLLQDAERYMQSKCLHNKYQQYQSHRPLSIGERPKYEKQDDSYRDEVSKTSNGGSSQNRSPRQNVNGNCRDSQDSDEISKHLIKTVSDLPVFVTIEGYRVASYSIGGEPHLCLPNLLQFIQQRYPIEKAVEIFEDTVTNFVSATPKQIQGFIKAIVLPPDAKSCPLIRRSDADRICLALFDQCSEDNIDEKSVTRRQSSSPSRGDTQRIKKQDAGIDTLSATISRNSGDTQRTKDPKSSDQEIHSPSLVSGQYLQCNDIFPRSCGSVSEAGSTADDDKSNDKSTQELSSNSGKSNKPTHIKRTDHSQQGKETLKEDEWATSKLLTCTITTTSTSNTSNNHHFIEKSLSLDSDDMTSTQGETSSDACDQQGQAASSRERLFELEAQTSILDLARAATSTLVIQVYHRCFGKCNGYYYPALMKDSESESIECATCHRRFSPRRFIGHTHGSKEKNVCHWGFNSYNWRNYIRLSRKQNLNNLDDDELIVQFDILKSFPDNNSTNHNEEEEDLTRKGSPTRSNVSSASMHNSPSNAEHLACAQDSMSNMIKTTVPRAYPYRSAIEPIPPPPTPHQVSTPGSHRPTSITDVYTPRPSTSKRLSLSEVVPLAPRIPASHSRRSMSLWPPKDQIPPDPYAMTLESSNHHSLGGSNNKSQVIAGDDGLNLALDPAYCPSLAAAYCGLSPMVPTSSTQQLLPSHSRAEFDLARSNILLQIPLQGTIGENGDRIRPYADRTLSPTRGPPSSAAASLQQLSSSINQPYYSLTTERLIKQDIFVSTGLVNYLSSRGMPADVAKDITDNALDLIHKSRILF